MAQSARAAENTDCISAEGSPSPKKRSRYNTKQSDGKTSVILEIWRMQSTPSLPSLPDQLNGSYQWVK